MPLLHKDATFSFEVLRALGYAPYGGADIAECLTTASRISARDFESWQGEWSKTARRAHALADEAKARGYRVGAREAYLRASNYYRTAEFFLHGNPSDPRIRDTWGKSRTTFREALALLDTPVEEILIPYEGTTLPGYFYRPDESADRRPTLMVHGGYDSTERNYIFWWPQRPSSATTTASHLRDPGRAPSFANKVSPFAAIGNAWCHR